MSTQREDAERRAKAEAERLICYWPDDIAALPDAITDALLAWGEECRKRALEEAAAFLESAAAKALGCKEDT